MPEAQSADPSRAGVASATAGRVVTWALALWMLAAGLGGGRPAAAGEVSRTREAESTEYRVKAAMLLKFVRYTTWPEESFEGDKAPFVVEVIGDDPFGEVLDHTFEGQKVKGRGFEIRRSKTVPAKVGAHVVFSTIEDEHLRDLLISRCVGRAILLVGDESGFATSGALMNFAIVDANIRFEINKDVLEKSPLTISSELLKLARIVKTKKKDEEPGEREGRREEAKR